MEEIIVNETPPATSAGNVLQDVPAVDPVQPNILSEATELKPPSEVSEPQAAETTTAPEIIAEAPSANPCETAGDSVLESSQCGDDSSATAVVEEHPVAESESNSQEENTAALDSANPPDAESSSLRLGELLSAVQSMTERIEAVEKAFPILRKDVLLLAKTVSGLYTTTTDRMHAKIEKYDRGLEQTIAKPYLLSIAKIGDALRRSLAEAEANPESALAQLQSLKDDIHVPLWNAGLRTIEIEPGVTTFNPRLHDGIDIVKTGDKALDGMVESVVETGYLFAPETDDPNARPRVFRAALVKVFKFDKTLESPISSSDDQPTSDDQQTSVN